MSRNLRNPEEQDDRNKRDVVQSVLTHALHTHYIPMQLGTTAIEGMTSIGTDFKKHAKWQGSVEEPAAKDFVARKVHTIEINKVQGTIWNTIECEEHLRSRPAAVIRKTTINLDSQVWKSLWDSFPKLYCVAFAKAYVTRDSVSSRI
jgi:hypothetical protein